LGVLKAWNRKEKRKKGNIGKDSTNQNATKNCEKKGRFFRKRHQRWGQKQNSKSGAE